MADNAITLSQDEINLVLNTVREDNAEHSEKDAKEPGLSLSQADLDRLFGGGSTPQAAAPEDVQDAARPDDAAAARAAKIAERKARAAALLAQTNARSPKRISVVYGTTMRTGAEIDSLQEGAMLELDRAPDGEADILVDGKPFARGRPGTADGHTTVEITKIL